MDLTYEAAVSVVNADLIQQLPDVPIRWSVPNPAPDRFVAVHRVGSGSGAAWADPAALDFHCYAGGVADSPKAADELANRVKRALGTMADRANRVAKVTITGHASLPDPVSGRPRVIVGATVVLRPH